jgi:hypothetical protein
MWIAGLSCIAGFALTWSLLPEPKGLDLEEASRDKTFERRSQQPSPASA